MTSVNMISHSAVNSCVVRISHAAEIPVMLVGASLHDADNHDKPLGCIS